jgi:ribonuclease P protein component
MAVSRKVGGAVRRNRVKRLLREVFRRHRVRLDPPLDLVINAHPSIVDRNLDELEQEFLRSFSRLARRKKP